MAYPPQPFIIPLVLLLIVATAATTATAHAISNTQVTPAAKINGSRESTIPLTPIEREFLNAHNEVRFHSGLPPLTWDRKAAAYARWYATNHSKDCALIHSTGPFGENIFWGAGTTWTPRMAVKDWVREHKFYNRRFHTCKKGRMCGHYTQIIWRDTQRVGCAQVKCGAGDTYVVCSYDPPGNYQGRKPFERHNPAMYNKSDRLTKISWIPNFDRGLGN